MARVVILAAPAPANVSEPPSVPLPLTTRLPEPATVVAPPMLEVTLAEPPEMERSLDCVPENVADPPETVMTPESVTKGIVLNVPLEMVVAPLTEPPVRLVVPLESSDA